MARRPRLFRISGGVMGIQWRSPGRAALLSAVTITVYGFWWWFDVNRQLQRAGGHVRAWRSLAAVTVGWVGIVFPFRSVEATTADIVAAQREAGLSPTMRTQVPLRIAIVATIGLALFALSATFPPAFFLFGWTPIAFGMLFVWYVQRELNRLAAPGRLLQPITCAEESSRTQPPGSPTSRAVV